MVLRLKRQALTNQRYSKANVDSDLKSVFPENIFNKKPLRKSNKVFSWLGFRNDKKKLRFAMRVSNQRTESKDCSFNFETSSCFHFVLGGKRTSALNTQLCIHLSYLTVQRTDSFHCCLLYFRLVIHTKTRLSGHH